MIENQGTGRKPSATLSPTNPTDPICVRIRAIAAGSGATKPHDLWHSILLVIAIKLKAKYRFYASGSSSYIFQKQRP
jgi:hypothetical protein